MGLERYRGRHEITEISLKREDMSYGGMRETTLTRDGKVVFRRKRHENPSESEMTKISPSHFEALAKLIQSAGFFAWQDWYDTRFSWGGRPNDRITLTVTRGGVRKSTGRYDFADCGPIELHGIEYAIEGVAAKAEFSE